MLALTHRSYAYEHGGMPTNERLEFLGDSVLSIVVTERLYRDHPDLPEGQLAKLRASVVNMHAWPGWPPGSARRPRRAPVPGPRRGADRRPDKASILADATEALIGAVYLEHGLEVARGLIHRLFDELLLSAPQLGAGLDWKTSLQELTAAGSLGVPEYRINEDGPDHPKSSRPPRWWSARSSARARAGPRRRPSRRRPSWPGARSTAEAGAASASA